MCRPTIQLAVSHWLLSMNLTGLQQIEGKQGKSTGLSLRNAFKKTFERHLKAFQMSFEGLVEAFDRMFKGFLNVLQIHSKQMLKGCLKIC